MFKKIFDLSEKKTTKEAVMFYIAFVAAGIIICGLGTFVMAIIMQISGAEDIQSAAVKAGPIIGGLYSLCVSLAILLTKKLYKNVSAVLCVIISAFASTSLGLLVGFIPAAVLTVFEKNNKNI